MTLSIHLPLVHSVLISQDKPTSQECSFPVRMFHFSLNFHVAIFWPNDSNGVVHSIRFLFKQVGLKA